MIKTFRIRLFVTATAIVALAVSLVMWTSWFQILEFEVGRLDVGLCSEARRLSIEKYPAADIERLEADISMKLRLESRTQVRIQVLGTGAADTFQSKGMNDISFKSSSNWQTSGNDCTLTSFVMEDKEWRAARNSKDGVNSIVAADLFAPTRDIRNAVLRAVLLQIPFALILTAAGAWALSVLMMKPITRLREAMKSLTTHDFGRPLHPANEDVEFKELIGAYNVMLQRLQRSFVQATRFSADAAHELKTPLTILRGQIEQMSRNAESTALQEKFSTLLDEVSRLTAITRKLLLLSQADAGLIELTKEEVNISEMLNDICLDAQMLSEDKQIHSKIEMDLKSYGDIHLLQQLFNNIISNAVRHSTLNSEIHVTAWRNAKCIYVRFLNSCQPISLEERSHLFDRFFRGDTSRNRRLEGSGLGLSLALEIAKAHGGELILQDSSSNVIDLLLTLPAR